MARDPAFLAPIAEQIWDLKYRLRNPDGTPRDACVAATFERVATAAAAVEPGGKRNRTAWTARFHDAMSDFGLLPAGRILAGAGAGRSVTLFNCFVMGPIADDLSNIFDSVKQAALTMQQGGGVGMDFSTLRPRGALVRSIGADASGPVSFMDVWDAMCRTIMSAGSRRGAMMACLRCDHPDIEAFIDAKADPSRLRNFNLSVLVTDAFMAAVQQDAPWSLVFGGKVWRTLPALALWERIMRATYTYAEPGVIFIDRINARNNLAYCETISATNPCGEQPLPPFGACLLGSINLARLVADPFDDGAAIPAATLEERVRTAVRLLDNMIDVSNYPLAAQKAEAKSKRRIGLGVTGLADALIMCGARYGEPASVKLAEGWMATIQRAAYLASAELAGEKGVFALYDAEKFLQRPNVEALDGVARAAIERHGIRNGCLTSIAPTGTISLFAGNVSSGIEPVFDHVYSRRVLSASGAAQDETVEDYAHAMYRKRFGQEARLGRAFVTAHELAPLAHLDMQAALQRHVDSSISKTINCPERISFSEFQSIYADAYDLGLKGCTTYRPNPVTGAVLRMAGQDAGQDAGRAPHESQPAGNADVANPPAGSVPALQAAGGVERESRAGVVYMSRPLERDLALAGFTYKLKWPGSDHALYVTINDIERDGRRRPFEIFINTKNLEHHAWTVALTRMISAVFRRGGDVSFVVEELKAVFDPQGGTWMDGRYVPSLLAAIGEVIEAHMIRTGFLSGTDAVSRIDPARIEMLPAKAAFTAPHASSFASQGRATRPQTDAGGQERHEARPTRFCPRCSSTDYVRAEGCWTCRSCGYSRCS
jgi:ribonucleoside-diphosphate reductase alpha chain